MPTLSGIAFIALGAALAGVGVWLFLFKRPKPRKPGDSATIPTFSEPTRISLAVLCLVAGYNLILWAFPPTLAAVQLPRAKWYIWVAVGICLALLTLRLDKFERDRASTDDPPRP